MSRAGFALGDIVAGHRIDAEIGRGGMGLVYRATHLRLNQQRAIKVISPDSADDPEFRERFERETKIAASIDHPHVAEVSLAADISERECGLRCSRAVDDMATALKRTFGALYNPLANRYGTETFRADLI